MLGRMRTAVGWVGLALLFAACASDEVPVATTFDPLTVFPTQATYVWDDRVSSIPERLREAQVDFEEVFKEAVDESFAARGYRVVPSRPADFYLSYEMLLTNWYASNNTRAIASVSLFLVESARRRRVWTGVGRADVRVGLNREERKARLRKSLDHMLENFPPAQRGE